MTKLTAGQLLDVVARAAFILDSHANAYGELVRELREVRDLLSEEIGASHMGTGADVVLIERGDA